MTFFAYCWRTGAIEFGAKVPPGALRIDHGGERSVRRRCSAHARHAYDGRTLLVPGVPEADNDIAALNACTAFKERMDKLRRRPQAPLFAAA